MNKTAVASVALFSVLASGLAQAVEFLNVSYDPTRELYQDFNKDFGAYWKSKTGQDVTFKQSHGGRDGCRQPAQLPARGERADEDAGIHGVAPHPDAITEQRTTGEWRGWVDGQHGDGASVRSQSRHQGAGHRGLADPRGAGDADDMRRATPRERRDDQVGIAVARFDKRDRPGERSRGALRDPRGERGEVVRTRHPAGAGLVGGGDADDQCVALPTATAQGCRTHAAAAACQLQGERQGDPGT